MMQLLWTFATAEWSVLQTYQDQCHNSYLCETAFYQLAEVCSFPANFYCKQCLRLPIATMANILDCFCTCCYLANNWSQSTHSNTCCYTNQTYEHSEDTIFTPECLESLDLIWFLIWRFEFINSALGCHSPILQRFTHWNRFEMW